MKPFSTGRLNASSPKSLHPSISEPTYVHLSRVLRAMQLGITLQSLYVGSSADTSPALIEYAPLSRTMVLLGSTTADFLEPFGGMFGA